MPPDHLAALREIKAEFEKGTPGAPALYHALIVGATGQDAAPYWQSLVPEARNLVSHEGIFVDGKTRCVGYYYTIQPFPHVIESLQRFDHLAKAARQTLAARGGIHGEARKLTKPTRHTGQELAESDIYRQFLDIAPGGVAWLADLYRVVWGGGAGLLLRADKFSAAVNPSARTKQVRYIPAGEKLPPGYKLLFPHEYYCKLQPDVFTASAHAINTLARLAGDDKSARRSSPMSKAQLVRRMMNSGNARQRDIDWTQYDLRSWGRGGRKWTLDLNAPTIDASMRERLEKPIKVK